MVIVYLSNTGFTQEYARMLAGAEKVKCYTLAEAQDQLEQGAQVFYMGPLMAGHIKGVDQAVKSFAVKGVCGVGMTPPGAIPPESLAKANYVPNGAPIFYLQGGWAPRKVGWLKRRMVGMATKSMRESLQAKGSRTPEEEAQLKFLTQGGSFVAFEKLEPIREWMGKKDG